MRVFYNLMGINCCGMLRAAVPGHPLAVAVPLLAPS